MNINNPSFYQSSLYFIRNYSLPVLTSTNKKILMVTSVVFTVLAVLKLIHSFCFQGSHQKKTILLTPQDPSSAHSQKPTSPSSHSITVIPGLKKAVDKTVEDDGTTCEGEFKNGRLKEGKKIYPNGTVVKGEFDGERVLKGIITKSTGEITEIISQLSDESGFKGKYTALNGDFQEGTFNYCGRIGLFSHGRMRRTLYNGDVEEGTYENNKLIMEKGIINRCGEILEGEFKDRELVKGKRIDAKGTIFEGTFDNSWTCKLHGYGKVTYANGDYEEGKFVYGNFLDGKKKITTDEIYTLIEGKVKDSKFTEGTVIQSTGLKPPHPENIIRKGNFTEKYGTMYLDGEGEYTLYDTLKGLFENDKLIKGTITSRYGLVTNVP